MEVLQTDIFELHHWASLAGFHGSCWTSQLWNTLTRTLIYLLLSSGSWTSEDLNQKEPQELGLSCSGPLPISVQAQPCRGAPGALPLRCLGRRVKVQLQSLAPQPLVPRAGHAGSAHCSGAFEGHPSFGIIRLLPWCWGCRSCTIKGVLLNVQSLLAVICSFHLVSINERTNNSRD